MRSVWVFAEDDLAAAPDEDDVIVLGHVLNEVGHGLDVLVVGDVVHTSGGLRVGLTQDHVQATGAPKHRVGRAGGGGAL